MVGIRFWLDAVEAMPDTEFKAAVRLHCEKENILDKWETNLTYFTEKRDEFKAFLQTALDLDSPIEWSV